MTARIKLISGKFRATLKDVSKKAPQVSQAVIKNAFRANVVGSSKELDLFAVRETMTRLLHSSGGRPSLAGAGSQVKIPKIEMDWTKIDALALATADLPHKPSPTQVAAIVLHLALSRIPAKDIEDALRREYA